MYAPARPTPTPTPAAPTTAPSTAPTTAPKANAYLQASVLTASPEQLQLLLYDGAIRFAEQARVALEARQFDQSYDRLTRAQAIIMELQHSLKPSVDAALCERMSQLYNFIYMRFVDANIQQDVAPLDEGLSVLRYQRETWVLLIQQTAVAKTEGAERALPEPSPAAQRVERLSLAG